MRLNFKYFRILLFVLCLGVSARSIGQSSANELKMLISKNLNSIGLSKEEADEFVINSNYKDAGSGIEYVYIQQTYKGIRVFNMVISLAFKNNILLYSSGKFLNPETNFKGTEVPKIEAVLAVSNAARHLKLKPVSAPATKQNNFKIDKKILFSGNGIAKHDIETELLWAQDDNGKVHLTWNVNIDVESSADWWNVRVDAVTGEIVNKDNWTVHEKFIESDNVGVKNSDRKFQTTNRSLPKVNSSSESKNYAGISSPLFLPPNVQNAAYRVIPYPLESKNFGSVTLDNNPWLKAGAVNNATTLGWHFDGTTNYSITRGNNVYAYDDSASIDNPGRAVTSVTQAPYVNFDVSPNFAIQPFDSTNRNFGIVNLFYWNNIIHDVFYQYGFTESAGNFQADNLGRGGSQNDFVRAEAQDGSGTDNANFSTPSDGTSGRMQMFLFSGIPEVTVTSPASIATKYTATETQLSTNNKLYKLGSKSGQVVFYNDFSSAGATHDACDSSAMPLNSVAGKIAYVTRGACPFTTKMRAAQKAGAIGVFMTNNVPGPPIGLGGTDNAVTIPGIMVSQEDGAKIAAEIPNNVQVTLTGGLLSDGDIDNGIVTHEYGHGISTRLTGGRTNASCLNNAEQGGEGWSDYAALMVTTNWQNAQLTDGSKLRPMGTYALGQTATGQGIRRVPYTTNILVDTLTYGSMDGVADGNGEVHRIGEIWCSALWDMTWNIIRHEGTITPDLYNSAGTGGNIIALKLVMEGLKLQPCRPGFLDSRNAILAADSILFNNSHKCDIWNAFAGRGMGYSAIQGSSNSTGDQVPAFDVPAGITIKRSTAPSIINTGAEISFNTTVSCQCDVPSGTFSISDTIPSGFTYIRSNNGTLNGNVVHFNQVSFSNSLETITLNLTLKATGAGCTITKPINDDREENVAGGLTAARISGSTANWITSATHSFSGTNAWYAASPNAANNITLTSGSFTPGSLSILSFWHYFVSENYLDGGKVEISINNGATWLDAKRYFLQNGYNGLLNASSPQPNTYAFTGTSYATGSTNNGQFIQSVIDLSSFANLSIKIRFRYQTNANNTGNQTYDGWYIDDIVLTNGCGGVSKLAVSDAYNNNLDSIASPIFIMANTVLPLTLVNFTAIQSGKQVLLNWITSAELSIKNFEVERSLDGINWVNIGTVPAKELDQNSYTYYDPSPLEHQNFYRIKINDKDGVYSYTNIKKIDLSDKELLTLVPNPATDKTIVYFGLNAKGGILMVTTLEGKVVQRHVISDNLSSYIIPTNNLPSGYYMIRLESKIGITTRKLVVAH